MSDISKILTTLEEVQTQVGQLPAPRDMKLIDFLDNHAQEWIRHSALIFLAFANGENLQLTAAAGTAGFIEVPDRHTITLPLASIDDTGLPKPNMTFGSLLFVPQMNETLRLNGRVESAGNEKLSLKIDECYLHCGKALLRSDFWNMAAAGPEPVDALTFLAKSRLMLLATVSADGQVDVSPKGDPSQSLLKKVGEYVWFADRPGNRRIDSFRNIVAHTSVASIALIPGSTETVEINGPAEICIDQNMQGLFAVNDKKPNLVVRIKNEELKLTSSPALDCFCSATPDNLLPPLSAPEIFRTHIKLSKERSLGAKMLRAFISVPGVLKKGIQADYKKNMY